MSQSSEVVEKCTPCSLKGESPLLREYGALGTARRAGSCTDMPILRTQTARLACGMEGSTHGSTGPSGRPLQTDLGDECIRRCTST